MATVAEIVGARPGEIPRVTVPFFNLGPDVKRMGPADSLSTEQLHKELGPNSVLSMGIKNPNNTSTEWRFIASASGYTPRGMHLMAMRWTEDYTPGFENVPVHEGEAIMFIYGNIASEMRNDPNTRLIDWGFNWSLYSFRQKGFQSIPTKTHPSLYGLPDLSIADMKRQYIEIVQEKALDRGSQLAIKGTFYNQQAGRSLLYALQSGRLGDQIVVEDLLEVNKATLDYRGLRIPTRKPIDDTLRTAGVFENLIHPISVYMSSLATNVSVAFTDFEPLATYKRITGILNKKYSSEQDRIEDTDAALVDLTRIPSFLPKDERLKGIRRLSSIYPEKFIDYLNGVSSKLPDGELAPDWKVGGAHMISLHYDKKTGEGFLAVFATMIAGPGGIVEATEGMLLQRPSDPFPPEEVAARRAFYRQQIEGALDRRNGYHEKASIGKIFV